MVICKGTGLGGGRTVFSNIKSKTKKQVYMKMWNGNSFINKNNITNAIYRGRVTDNSFVFDTDGLAKCEGLMKIFGIKQDEDMALFSEKFEQACDGSGSEENRITTLHSSSLCALLFFYNISETHPLVLSIEGEEVTFTESIFEYQNKVTDNGSPSNMDVTLLGTRNGNNVVLFLESKFAEYILDTSMTLRVKKEYLKNRYSEPIYKSKFWEDLRITLNEDTNDFMLCSDCKMYLGGLKQMISHYVGVRRFVDGEIHNCGITNKQALQEHVSKYVKETTKIYLGTILFDDKINEIMISDEVTYFDSYKYVYSKLTDVLNEKLEIDNISQIKVLSKIFTYKEVFGELVDTQGRDFIGLDVRKFYFG